MYFIFPDYFGTPVYYTNRNMLGIFSGFIDNNYTSYNNLDKTIKRKKITIGVSLPTQNISRWLLDKNSFEKYANSKDVILKMEISNYDKALQDKQVENLISQNIDVLILVPLDSIANSTLVDKAKKAGIKVIAYDSIIYNSDVDLFLSFNGLKIGELQGQFLTEKVPKGNYILLSGDPFGQLTKLIRDGAMQYITPLVNIFAIKIVADKEIPNWDPDIAYSIVKEALINNKNKIDAILAPNDGTAGGAIKALKEQGLAGKVIVTGQDAELSAIKRIIEGTQSMTVLKDSRELAKVAIDSAIKLEKGQSITTNANIFNGKKNVPATLLTPVLVTRDNIPSTIIKTGFFSGAEVYGQ